MDKKMFCFQCEQTARCIGCTGNAGVCGKTADTAKLQDELTGALIGLARAYAGNEELGNADTHKLVKEALFATITNVNFDNQSLSRLKSRVQDERNRLVSNGSSYGSACEKSKDYDMNALWNAEEDIRSLKSLILFGIRGVAAYAYHAAVLGYESERVNTFFYKALAAIGMDNWGMEELLPIVMEVGEVNLVCMELLDQANTETYGTPVPVEVSLKTAFGTDAGQWNQHLYTWRNAACPWISRTEKI